MGKNILKVSEVTAIYSPKVKPSERFVIKNSKDAFEVIKNAIKIEEQGHFEKVYIILLNNSNKVLGVSHIADGAISGCIIDPRIVFQRIITANATSFILWHNHPGGNLTPSEADIKICKKLKKGAEILDINFLDSIIIDCEGNYRSMIDKGDF